MKFLIVFIKTFAPSAGGKAVRKENNMRKEKSNLRIRIKDGKTYVSLNYGEWLVNTLDDLTEDMRLILNTLCRMDEYDVTIDAKIE